MRDRSSALEASERSMRESILTVLCCESAVAGRIDLRRADRDKNPQDFFF